MVMWIIVVLAILMVVILVNGQQPIRMKCLTPPIDCDSADSVNEFPEGLSAVFECFGSDFFENTETLTWYLQNETGQTLQLAECYGPGNCSSSYNTTVLSVSEGGTGTAGAYLYSQLRFKSIVADLAGTLRCTEKLKSGFINSTTCRMSPKRVYLDAFYDVREGHAISIACKYVQATPTTTVMFTLRTSGNQGFDLGSCKNGTCLAPLSPNVTLTQVFNSTSTTLHLQGVFVTKEIAGELMCTSSSEGALKRETASLHVYYEKRSPTNCSVEVKKDDWTLRFSCDVEVFTSSGVYEVGVLDDFNIYLGRRQSVLRYLTKGTDTTGRELYSGRVQYIWPLPATAKHHVRYLLYIFLNGAPSYNSPWIDLHLPVSSPSKPRYDCSGDPYRCVCAVDDLGSPEGRLKWLLGDTAIATGDYGVKALELPQDKMPQDDEDGLVPIACVVDWIESERVTVTDRLAYASSAADLTKWIAVGLGAALGVAIVVIIVVVIILCRRRNQGTPASTDYNRPTVLQPPVTYSDVENYDVIQAGDATAVGVAGRGQMNIYENSEGLINT